MLHVFLLSSLIGQLIVTVDSERETGFYINNGHNQTTMERWLSSEEKTALEHRILRLLGLPEKSKNPEKKPIMKRSAPKFLLDVYTNDIGKHGNNSGEFKLNERNLYTINQSDVIISFMAQQPHQGLGGKPDRVKRMWFDVSAVPVDDDIMMSAELRLYRGPEANTNRNRGAFTVAVYRVLRDTDGNKDFHFVDSVNTGAGYTGWITLDVSESLQIWTKQPEENRGLYITVVSTEGTDSYKVKPENIGIIGFKGSEEKQPFMVGFYKNSGKRSIQLRINDIVARHPRNALDHTLEAMQNYYLKNEHLDVQILRESCGLRTLYVNFKDIQWQDWIIAPSGFDAFYCSGECNFPLQTRMNATNHAIIQNLMHLKQPDEVPKSCCAPTKYSALTVLYFQDENNVVLKKYQNMIVNRCGCL
ncbi:protein 60A isoform X2 [Diachasma alloeum]|nr:protein 60A isoform X2 [Diachasma alloeum]